MTRFLTHLISSKTIRKRLVLESKFGLGIFFSLIFLGISAKVTGFSNAAGFFLLLSFLSIFIIPIFIMKRLRYEWIMFRRNEVFLIKFSPFMEKLGFHLVDQTFFEGNFQGYLCRVNYYRDYITPVSTKVDERTGNTIVTKREGIKFTCFTSYSNIVKENALHDLYDKEQVSCIIVDGFESNLRWDIKFNTLSYSASKWERMELKGIEEKLALVCDSAKSLQLTPFIIPTNNRIDWFEFNEHFRAL